MALGAITSIVYSGCVGGGASGGGNGINPNDEHGDTPLTATVILPDGGNMVGQINYPRSAERPADVDYFRFRGIQDVVYTIQISGFPPDPDVDIDLDLTGDGDDVLTLALTGFDGTTQPASSAGSANGEPYDVDPAGLEDDDDNVLGDTRVLFPAPVTGDYYIRVAHRREDTGIGAYELRIASSQLSTIDGDDAIFQSGARFVTLATQQDGIFFTDVVAGYIGFGIEIDETSFISVFFDAGFDPWITFPGQDDPSPGLVHIHAGHPNNFVPEFSFNLTPGDVPNPALIGFTIQNHYVTIVNRTQEATMTLEDGSVARIPVDVTQEPIVLPNGMNGVRTKLGLHLADAVSDTRGGEDLSPELFRRIIGFSWYGDVHPHNQLDIDSEPVATSRPYGGMYQIFETDFDMDPTNVVVGNDVPADRGTLQPFKIFYDSALKLFQVATQQYTIFDEFGGFEGVIIDPDYADYVGDRVRVREGQPGENGPVLIDLGTLPALAPPPTAFFPDLQTKIEEPGFRAPIRQLSDEEALELRDAFYDERRGFYIEVTDAQTQQRLVRAEGNDLEISFFPSEGRCGFPPCTEDQDVAGGQTLKGVVSFASSLPGNVKLDLYANGELLGVLKDSVDTNALPACGLGGDNRTLAAELWPDTYYWHAYGSDGKTYDGHFTTTPDGCQLVVVTPEDANE